MSGFRDLLGKELPPSDWHVVTQEQIDAFAAVTGDRQWIHVDAERAERESPFGATVAHGFLTLSLVSGLRAESFAVTGYAMVVNYGLDRVRFPSPVPAGSRVRARFRVLAVEDTSGGERAVVEATVERDGSDKPVCVAELVLVGLR
jgi:acyl dehydratase